MTATASAKAAADTTELLTVLAVDGETTLSAAIQRCGEPAVAAAWAKGEIEFGRTKYVTSGNPATAVDVHNGVKLPRPTLIVEGGLEWTGPKQRHHEPLAKILAEKVPVLPAYQKYQLEVCVNRDRDVWEWLEDGDAADGRDTRYARREIKRAEAEALIELRVRLTDKGHAVFAN